MQSACRRRGSYSHFSWILETSPFQGVCCVDISIDNIISIVDTPPVVVDIPNNLDTQGIFLRTDFGIQSTVRNVSLREHSSLLLTELKAIRQPSASWGCDGGHKLCRWQGAKWGSPQVQHAKEWHCEVGFICQDLSIVNLSRFDQNSQVLLEATRRIKAQNNLTDLEAGIGLRNDFNSDTNAAIRERWVEPFLIHFARYDAVFQVSLGSSTLVSNYHRKISHIWWLMQ